MDLTWHYIKGGLHDLADSSSSFSQGNSPLPTMYIITLTQPYLMKRKGSQRSSFCLEKAKATSPWS